MQLLKNRKFAAFVAVAACIFALFFGTTRSLNKFAHATNDLFYTGVEHEIDGYIQPSIASQLEFCIDQALGIVTVARNYPELANAADKVADERDSLIGYIEDEAPISISLAAACNVILNIKVNNLLELAESVELSERDREILDAYASDFRSAQLFIDTLAEGYMAEIEEYFEVANAVPAKYFRINSPNGADSAHGFWSAISTD